MGVFLVTGLLMTDKDDFVDSANPSVPEDQKELRDEKLGDENYWESKIGRSYSGYSSVNSQVTVYDTNENEYYFVWDSELMDFVEDPNKQPLIYNSEVKNFDENQQEMMKAKVYDAEYWEGRIGSYGGTAIDFVTGQASISDDDGRSHYFVWDEEAEDFLEADEHYNVISSYEADPYTSSTSMIDEPPVTTGVTSSDETPRAEKNMKEQAAKAKTMDEKRRSFAYWKSKIGGYTGQSANETGTSVTVYDANGFSHYFTWSESANDYIER
jgi:hypothetical protein